MPELELRGLSREGFPVAALAAYGLLRVLAEGGVGAGLSFADPRGRPVARLHLPEGWEEERLLGFLEDHTRRIGPERFGLPPREEKKANRKGKKQPPGEGENQPQGKEAKEGKKLYTPGEVRARLASGDQASPFLLAYVNPWWEPKGQTIRSPLDTSSGNQNFWSFLWSLLDLVKKYPMRPVFRRALFKSVILPPDPLLREEDPGHPLFGDEVPDLKWHPVRKRESADQAELADEEKKELTLRVSPGALLLALEALPFYPFPLGRSSLPLGFARERGGKGRSLLLLPTSEHPVDVELLKALIALAPHLKLKGRTSDLTVWASPLNRDGRNDYPCFLQALPFT